MEDEKRELKEKKSKKKAEDSCVAPAPCSACGGSEEVYRDDVMYGADNGMFCAMVSL